MTQLTCFKAYDIRGQLGTELNEAIAYRIGRAYAQYLNAKKVVVGGDVRATSEALKQALAQGIMDAGCDVIDLGMTGTEEVYFAAFHLDVDGGIEVTASHNPIDFNGMKLVKRDAQPISGDSGLKEIQQLAEQQAFTIPEHTGQISQLSLRQAYLQHLLTYIDVQQLKPLKLVVNAGNGAAGPVIDALEAELQQRGVPITFIKVTPPARPDLPQRYSQPATGGEP
jgi:phosphomannomutase/phosphomannomutase/phosphoglucomutase